MDFRELLVSLHGHVARLRQHCREAHPLCRYSGTAGRTCKPFNPLLGETFEYVDKQRKFRFLAEKVIHHPTVVAAHCEGHGWVLDADLEVKSKFWGRCIELKPIAHIEVFHYRKIAAVCCLKCDLLSY
jgi:hypothetical protein